MQEVGELRGGDPKNFALHTHPVLGLGFGLALLAMQVWQIEDVWQMAHGGLHGGHELPV